LTGLLLRLGIVLRAGFLVLIKTVVGRLQEIGSEARRFLPDGNRWIASSGSERKAAKSSRNSRGKEDEKGKGSVRVKEF
jgi:hypothetical protein